MIETIEQNGLHLPKRFADPNRNVMRDIRRLGQGCSLSDRQYDNLHPRMRGGSFLTGTSAEVLYSSVATGTQLNTFTTEDNLQKTLPHVIIPAGFFYAAQGGTGKCLKVRALMRIGATATPTFTWTVRLLTSTTWSAAGVAWSTAASTVAATTLGPAILDFDIICRTVGTGGAANTTLAGMGFVAAGALVATAGAVFSIPASNTAFTNTIDSTVTQYLYISIACSASSASNLAQLEMLKVYGEN